MKQVVILRAPKDKNGKYQNGATLNEGTLYCDTVSHSNYLLINTV